MNMNSPVLRVLIAPDSFKGSLEAADVARHLAAGVRRAVPSAVVDELPIADGGEGTAAVIAAALGGSWREFSVTDGNGAPRMVPVAFCASAALGEFAVFDMAQIAGLPDAVAAPEQRTTAGIGELIRLLHDAGTRTIAIGLGGSSTNDAGSGMLAQLAYDFTDVAGKVLRPVFGNLQDVTAVARRADSGWLGSLKLIGLTDVTSPLTGPNGASAVFGGQKGYQDLEAADARLARLAALFGADDQVRLPGAGAAGGLGFGMALLGAQLQAGADFICEATGVAARIADYGWVLTGEGRSDAQTLMGKGPATIAALARGAGVPVTLVAGSIDASPALDAAFDGCFSIVPGPHTLAYAMEHGPQLLEQTGYSLGKLFAYRNQSS
jgi:glycerate kinase